MSESPTTDRRQRKSRHSSALRSSSNDKKLKIKLTAAREGNRDHRDHSGSEDELEPDVAIEEQFILRMPPGEACSKLREMVRRRDVTEDVKFVFKGMQLCDRYCYVEGYRQLAGRL
jgi:transcription initiation factor TFIID subunit 7